MIGSEGAAAPVCPLLSKLIGENPSDRLCSLYIGDEKFGENSMEQNSVTQGSHRVVKPPAVAGLFYPSNADQLRRDVDAFLDEAPPREHLVPKALIAPHAGYVYSGSVAATIYRQLRLWETPIQRVVVFGPAHRVGFRGIAVHSADSFRTPLGDVPLERESIEALKLFPFVHELDQAFAEEHCLEVQLPFLQRLLSDFRLIPLLVGQCGYAEVEQLIEQLAALPETLIVISSDLSHFHDYNRAKQWDAGATQAIEALNAAGLEHEHACGRIPIGGLLGYAKRHGLKVVTLDLRNSGDTAGPKNRVVGYGAYAFI
jgi:hypothetical protein